MTPRCAAGGQLDVDAALRRPARIQRVRILEQIGVLLHELPQPDRHALLIALRDHETLTHTKLAGADGRRIAAAEALVMRYLTGPTDLNRDVNSSPSLDAEAA